jgi:hypothetical protein
MAIGLCAIRQGDHGVAPYRQTITAPAAWTNRSIGGKAGLTHQLTPAQLAAFEIVLAGTRHLKPLDTTRSDFDHPEINAVADWLSETIRHGRGAVLLSGLTRAAHSEEDMERIYWYIGTCSVNPPYKECSAIALAMYSTSRTTRWRAAIAATRSSRPTRTHIALLA